MDKYQAKTSSDLEKIGFGIDYGLWDDDFNKLEKTITKISDYSVRKKMFFSGRELVDGLGSNKILEEILIL